MTPRTNEKPIPETPLEVSIRNLSSNGAFVGNVTGPEGSPHIGMTAFVPYTAAGETPLVQVQRMWSKHLEAEAISIPNPSTDRVEPLCPHYGTCGGCHTMHLSHPAQLIAKQTMVQDSLATGGLPELVSLVEPVVEGPEFGYRQRVTLQVTGARAGYFERRTHRLMPPTACPVTTPGIEKRIAKGIVIRGIPLDHDAQLFIEEGDNGVFGVLDIKGSPKKVAVDRIVAQLARDFDGGQLRIGGAVKAVYGRSHVHRTIDGAEQWAVAGGFQQANRVINEALIQAVADIAADSKPQRAADLYAGAGNFAFAMAQRNIPVIAVESNPLLAGSAKAESKRRSLNLKVHDDSVEHYVRNGAPHAELIVADPPRAGLDTVARKLHGYGARTLVLLSCHVPAMVRDLRALQSVGWTVKSITPYDMFAQTAHVEVLTVLTREDDGEPWIDPKDLEEEDIYRN